MQTKVYRLLLGSTTAEGSILLGRVVELIKSNPSTHVIVSNIIQDNDIVRKHNGFCLEISSEGIEYVKKIVLMCDLITLAAKDVEKSKYSIIS